MKPKRVTLPANVEESLKRLSEFFSYAEAEDLPLGEEIFLHGERVWRWLDKIVKAGSSYDDECE